MTNEETKRMIKEAYSGLIENEEILLGIEKFKETVLEYKDGSIDRHKFSNLELEFFGLLSHSFEALSLSESKGRVSFESEIDYKEESNECIDEEFDMLKKDLINNKLRGSYNRIAAMSVRV